MLDLNAEYELSILGVKEVPIVNNLNICCIIKHFMIKPIIIKSHTTSNLRTYLYLAEEVDLSGLVVYRLTI